MATALSPPEQRIVLRNVSWETYERLLADHMDSSSPRFTYDRGALEIISPSSEHEELNRSIALFRANRSSALHGCEAFANGREATNRRKDLITGFQSRFHDKTLFYSDSISGARRRTM